MRGAVANASSEVVIAVAALWDPSAPLYPRTPQFRPWHCHGPPLGSVVPQPLLFYTSKTQQAVSQSHCDLTGFEAHLRALVPWRDFDGSRDTSLDVVQIRDSRPLFPTLLL